jgi:DNA-binding transcriptional MerR regulator
METMRIGVLAAVTGHSAHTIRWYESQRLIPGVRRDTRGRRVYSEQHIGWLRFLDRLKFTGMTIRQMREYAALVSQGDRSLPDRRELLQAHRERTASLIREMTLSLELIDTKLAFYAAWIETGEEPPPVSLPTKTVSAITPPPASPQPPPDPGSGGGPRPHRAHARPARQTPKSSSRRTAHR